MTDEYFWTRQELDRATLKQLQHIADFYGIVADKREDLIVGILTVQHDNN